MNFSDRLCRAIRTKQTPICVGLDPRIEHLPAALRDQATDDPDKSARLVQQFCTEIIDVVANLVPVVKPNAAFFEALGPAGMSALRHVNQYAQKQGLIVLLDGKRGDIGSTASAYARAYLQSDNPWNCDALTVNPYLGRDALEPMLQTANQHGTGIFLLVKTSNPGSADLQDTSDPEQTKVFERVAALVRSFNRSHRGQFGYGNCGAVVGATWPEQLVTLRQQMPHAIFLIPGIGAQGGDIRDIRCAFDEQGCGALVNSSRGIIFAYEQNQYASQTNWQAAVESATRNLIEQLQSVWMADA